MSAFIWLGKLTQPNFHERARSSKLPQLVTIPYSHYVDFARWSLQLGGKSFEEHGYPPVYHVLAVLTIRVNGPENHLSDSSFVQSVGKEVSTNSDDGKSAKRATKARATAVPVMCCPDGKVLRDSWEIASLSGIDPIDDDLKGVLDQKLGPMARQIAYHYVLKPTNKNVWDGMCTSGKNWFWCTLWWLYLGKIATGMLLKIFQPQNESAVHTCRENLKVVVAELDERLKTRKGPFLNGDSPGMADIALAALAAPACLPREYCEGKYVKYFGLMEKQDLQLQEELAYWRATEVGKFCLMMYSDRRHCVTGPKDKPSNQRKQKQ